MHWINGDLCRKIFIYIELDQTKVPVSKKNVSYTKIIYLEFYYSILLECLILSSVDFYASKQNKNLRAIGEIRAETWVIWV